MGLSDRDYMRDREAPDFRPEPSSAIHWLWIVPLAASVLLVTLGPPGWMPAKGASLIQQVRVRLGLSPPPTIGNLPAASNGQRTPAGTGASVGEPPRHLPGGQVVRRCVVNGVVVDVLNGECPPAVAPPVARVATPQDEAPSNPFVQPGTIYRCKSLSNAGMFWSQAHCRQHNALIDRMASVPVGIPVQQQVDIAQAEARNIESTVRREQREGERSAICTSLRNERDLIWKRSGSGSGYTPLQQIDADQIRWKQIKAQMASSGCGA